MKDVRPSKMDICILIPCYNNIEGLVQSVESIVYHDGRYVIVIVDDGSAAAVTEKDLYLHIPTTVNIHIIRLQQNTGITRALNAGLDYIYANFQVRFIARLDCGDTCTAIRFFTQVAFFEGHPAIDLLGSWCYFKQKGTNEGYK